MSKKFLVLAEAHGIQNYVFGSNRLAENIGASYLVGQWSGEPLLDHLRSKGYSLEKVFLGGGNAMFEVETDEVNKAIHAFTRQILVECPGLLFTAVHEEIKQPDEFKKYYFALRKKLVATKRNRNNTEPQLSFAVTRRCESTGLPANGMTLLRENQPGTDFPANMEILQKYCANDQARKHLENLCSEQLKVNGSSTVTFPYQLDHLGRSAGEHSYIAVVHIDGDGMGQHLDDIMGAMNDDEAQKFLSDFSEQLKTIGTEALRSVVGQLRDNVNMQKDTAAIHHATAEETIPPIVIQKHIDGKWFLPFRPIIYGGDDLTFVCDGRLGVTLAVAFMKAFTELAQTMPGGAITASAGIAIVKAHYPFSRAYDLAEQLCRSAKDYKRREKLSEPCFDWHFALSGLAGDLDEIRKKEYQSKSGNPLFLRPYVLGDMASHNEHSWEHLRRLVGKFQGEEWLGRRNKMEKLKHALRDGKTDVAWFLQKYDEQLPGVDTVTDNWLERGWHNNKCLHFDALELADWYMPLKEGGSSS